MNYGLRELLTSCLALAAVPLFFLLPGYGVLACTGLMRARQKSRAECLLWATVLSLPISLLFCVHPGAPLSPKLTTCGLIAWDVFSCVLLLRDFWQIRPERPSAWAREDRITTIVAAALPVYVVLSTVPIVWRGRLYESTLWQDWTIRIQLVNAAIRGGNHPGNPMFAVGGHPAPLRYYYFWYVLCARMHDVVRVNSRAVFTASCAGAALALLAFLLLAVKYLVPTGGPVKPKAIAALIAASIIGLDAVPLALAFARHRFYPDVQFWLDDRSPSWLNMILWSPHHVAGFVCCGLGTLLLIYTLDVAPGQRGVHALLAGVCFAASAGTSTFVTLLFALGCLFVAVDALVRRQWAVVQAMAVATVIAACLAAPFLYAFLHTKAAAPGTQKSGHLLSVKLRYNNQAANLIWHEMKARDKSLKELPAPGDPQFRRVHRTLQLLRLPVIAALFLCDFGFFVFVLLWQFRQDFLLPGRATRRSRILWMLFAGAAVAGFLVSSAGTQTNNDLGRHAGFCMRFVLTLWAAPSLVHVWEQRRKGAGIASPLLACALLFAVVGVAGQVLQVAMTRVRFPLTDDGLLPRSVVEERVPHLAYRFGQIQRAMAAATRVTPPDGLVQSNPHARMHNVFMLYTDRQMAAADDGCNTPFGGDPEECAPEARALIQLFGGMGPRYQGEPSVFGAEVIHYDPSRVTPENFEQVCSALKLSTVVASYLDPAWWDHNSWVWKLHPVFANSTARVFSCQQTGLAGSSPSSMSQRPGSPYTGF